MADRSQIEWTDATWNPVTGCTQVSPGCDHCYAERITERFHGKGSFAQVRLHPERLTLPLRWRKPRMIFVTSVSDLFHRDVPGEYIAQVFAVMALASRHTFQVLTKRHGRMRSLLNDGQWRMRVAVEMERIEPYSPEHWPLTEPFLPLPNAWIGVSAEDQRRFDLRVPALAATPAAVRFVSAEPLLGPVDLTAWASGLDWVIAGGESGPGARPMHPDWARFLRDQCQRAGVAFFFKQWGEFVPTAPGCGCPDRWRDAAWQAGSEFWPVWRVGKHRAGRLLDGRAWDQLPSGGTR